MGHPALVAGIELKSVFLPPPLATGKRVCSKARPGPPTHSLDVAALKLVVLPVLIEALVIRRQVRQDNALELKQVR